MNHETAIHVGLGLLFGITAVLIIINVHLITIISLLEAMK